VARTLAAGLVPLNDPLLEDFEMFRVRHGRVTSLASAMLRMILTHFLERPHSMRPSPPRQRTNVAAEFCAVPGGLGF